MDKELVPGNPGEKVCDFMLFICMAITGITHQNDGELKVEIKTTSTKYNWCIQSTSSFEEAFKKLHNINEVFFTHVRTLNSDGIDDDEFFECRANCGELEEYFLITGGTPEVVH